MKIEILGTGCPKCKKLTENVQQALKEAGKEAEVAKIEDIKKITEYGIMMTPGLVIDGEVKSVGRVLTAEEIKRLVA
jgi:small redox-active disulfide protein 2